MRATIFRMSATLAAVVILGANSVVSALTVVPLFRLADRFFNRTTVIVATWTWAVVPYFMSWPAAWVWEAGWSAVLVVGLLYKACDLPDAPRWSVLRFGAFGGLAILTNPALLTVLPVATLWAVSRSALRGIAFRRALL